MSAESDVSTGARAGAAPAPAGHPALLGPITVSSGTTPGLWSVGFARHPGGRPIPMVDAIVT